ncbi:dephospho-CoA kinase [Bacillus shivajii]|uniref:dephospho-CoA kinase n=1 Tax=Bacillus shivajii TaxID=1983719 RepID=UPI00299F2544|nr:dephospho-CoA kinase [Bacillus shivajii]
MIIGLTGGIATGKSTVANMMEKMGLPIIDADQIARQVVEPGAKAHEEIIQTFGEVILREDRTIDRKKLGAIIFNDESKRSALNAIVHPAVRAEMKMQANKYFYEGYQSVVMDIPLLIESELHHMVDKILLVYVHQDIQLERLVARDQAGTEDAKSRIQSQLPIDEKKSHADAIIYNDKTLDKTKQQLTNILNQWNVKL